MATFVVKVLSVTLGLFFIFVGILKLYPIISMDLYKDMRKQYIKMVNVFPLAKYTGWRPSPHTYRKLVASIEITCGIILTIIPVGALKIAANILMIAVMCNDVLAHTQIKNGMERMSLPIVFVLLLTCRLVIVIQEKRRQENLKQQKAKETAVQQSKDREDNSELTAEEKKTQ